ncbi:MAG: hypothetical protein U9O94_10480 [Nanoarchaeota archaeon]|nr:hypothetical protein [Nanoarchaeota archaeon]
MKNIKKMVSMSILSLMLISMLAMFASAATTFVTPGASATIQGDYVINISTADVANATNCSVNGSSTLSGDSFTNFYVYNRTAIGAGTGYLNGTITSLTSIYEDASDWVFSAVCRNTTNSVSATSRTGITIDNTVPSGATGLTPVTTTSKRNIAFSSTVNGSKTTSCTATFTSAIHTETFTLTHSANTCSYTIPLLPPSEYTVTVLASDGLNSTTSNSTTITVKEGDQGGAAASGSNAARAAEASDSSDTTNKTVFFVIAAAVIIYALANQGGSSGSTRKRRKRRK